MKCKMILYGLLLLLVLNFTGCSKKSKAVSKEENPISVETTQVQKNNIAIETTLSGKIKPIQESSVISKTPGKVLSVSVEIGDYVHQGDVLFQLDTNDLDDNIKATKASYEMALANFNVKKENFENSKKNYERDLSLYEEGIISEKILEQSRLAASDAQLKSCESQVTNAKVSLENAQSKRSDCTVTAPISGYITQVMIEKGEMASAASPAINIANLDKVKIETTIAEQHINKVHVGDPVDVIVRSIRSEPFKGTVEALAPAPSKNNLTYPIKITLQNPESSIKAGMFAEISMISDQKNNVLAVPSDSVIIKEGKEVVFVVKDKKAHMKPVTLGMDNGELVEIQSGLTQGEIVITKGQNYVDEGNKVNILK